MDFYIDNLVNSIKDQKFQKFLQILKQKEYFQGINDYKTLSERLEKAKTKFYSSQEAKPEQKITKPQKPIKKVQIKDIVHESSFAFKLVSYLGITTYTVSRLILSFLYKIFSKKTIQ